MQFKELFRAIIVLALASFGVLAHAEFELKPFVYGSYQQIVANNADHPFIFVVWSINCASCLKDMALLSEIRKKNPDIKVIMLAADELSDEEQIKQILKQQQMEDVENWVFAEDNTQKLNYEIDPKWYGEIPRTYFYGSAQPRTGVSGVLTKEDYEKMLLKIRK